MSKHQELENSFPDWYEQDFQMLQANLQKGVSSLIIEEEVANFGQRLIMEVVLSLYCSSLDTASKACHTCTECRSILEQQHPDVYSIEKQKEVIPVDAIRELINWSSISSHHSNSKLAIIHEAQFLNTSSSNSLLKLLEEPLGSLQILLFTSNSQKLLPTIRSRSLIHRLKTPGVETILEQSKSLCPHMDTQQNYLLAVLTNFSLEQRISLLQASEEEKYLLSLLNLVGKACTTKTGDYQFNLKKLNNPQVYLFHFIHLILLAKSACIEQEKISNKIQFLAQELEFGSIYQALSFLKDWQQKIDQNLYPNADIWFKKFLLVLRGEGV